IEDSFLRYIQSTWAVDCSLSRRAVQGGFIGGTNGNVAHCASIANDQAVINQSSISRTNKQSHRRKATTNSNSLTQFSAAPQLLWPADIEWADYRWLPPGGQAGARG